jgi:hypothetical protein
LSESPQAPSALHPEFLWSWPKEPKPCPRLQRPNLRSGFLPLLASPGPPKTHSARFARSVQTVGRSQMGGGLAPAPGLAVLLSASGRGSSPTASSQQPGNGAVVEVRGCSAVGCWLLAVWHSAVSAICTPPKRAATRGLAKQASTTDPDSLFEWSEQSERSEFESAPGARALQGTPKGRGAWRSAFPPFWQDKRGSGCRADSACGLSQRRLNNQRARRSTPQDERKSRTPRDAPGLKRVAPGPQPPRPPALAAPPAPSATSTNPTPATPPKPTPAQTPAPARSTHKTAGRST